MEMITVGYYDENHAAQFEHDEHDERLQRAVQRHLDVGGQLTSVQRFLAAKVTTHRTGLRDATRALAALDRIPAADPCADGDVITFRKRFDTTPKRPYTYVAVRVAGRWYVSGRPLAGRAVTWDRLVEFMVTGGVVRKIWKLEHGKRMA